MSVGLRELDSADRAAMKAGVLSGADAVTLLEGRRWGRRIFLGLVVAAALAHDGVATVADSLPAPDPIPPPDTALRGWAGRWEFLRHDEVEDRFDHGLTDE